MRYKFSRKGRQSSYKERKERIVNKILRKEKTGYVRDLVSIEPVSIVRKRREFGAHLTSIDIFKKFILPEIKDLVYKYVWVDLFAGEGNLILPILEAIPRERRIKFFREHIFLFDIQPQMVNKAILFAEKYGIPKNVAEKNIKIRDTLQNYPKFIKKSKYPLFHITNPPYLYLGYIAKYSERNLKYFSGPNEGYQDLYQIALINDLRYGSGKMIYIIPTNFLFGFSISNKIRNDFFQFYTIKKAIIFERKIFEFTGTNVCICFFKRKPVPCHEPITFKALKINTKNLEKTYTLKPENFYRAGGEFNEFLSQFKTIKPLKIKFYLTLDEVMKNKGRIPVKLLNVNSFSNGYFEFNIHKVNQNLFQRLKQNPLFIRTLDTGGWEGRAGIYNIKEIFNVDGILVTKAKYRTHPIQIFLQPALSSVDLNLLKNYFNLILEYFRDLTDSEFLTTFKYSNSDYIRKYLGLSQVKKLIETFPVHLMKGKEKNILKILIEQKNIEGIKEVLSKVNQRIQNQLKLNI